MTDGPPQGRGTAAPASPELEHAASAERAGFVAVLRYFLRLGTSGFGGPIAVAGYMQRDLVEQRGWIAKQDFLNGIALGRTMPGPLAAQVAMWAGYLVVQSLFYARPRLRRPRPGLGSAPVQTERARSWR